MRRGREPLPFAPSRAGCGERIPVGEGPLSLVATDGAVWVINGDGSTVSKVEIERGQVVGNPIEISSYATGDSIAAGQGRVWVVLPDKARSSRSRPRRAPRRPDLAAGRDRGRARVRGGRILGRGRRRDGHTPGPGHGRGRG